MNEELHANAKHAPPAGAPPAACTRTSLARDGAPPRLQATADRTPPHHLEQLTPERARALLRGGADVRAGAPSPLERARTVGGEASALVLRAARWSEGSHELFPAAARAQAVAVLRLGYLLASARYATEATALTDAWRHMVLPHAMAP